MAIAKGTEKLRFFLQFSFYTEFPILKRNVCLAINRETIKTKCLVPQDMQECRVHQQLTFMKWTHVLSIVTEANHKDAACLSRSSFVAHQIKQLLPPPPLTTLQDMTRMGQKPSLWDNHRKWNEIAKKNSQNQFFRSKFVKSEILKK